MTQTHAASTTAEVVVRYVCRLPDVPGTDLVHPSRKSAEREAANARKIGQAADVFEVLMYLRTKTAD
ncbi:MAG: hypothetical protein ABIQ39_02040 [Ilumatobacteraceae bacterium]